jgi:PhnB protein
MNYSVYLAFDGTCEEAMNFYKDALVAEMIQMSRFGDMPDAPPMPEEQKNRVLHSIIGRDGWVIMASDSNDQHPVTFGNNASISLDFKSEEEIDKTFAAISAGGNVTMPLQDTFWGAKFGMCVDKFGTSWLFNYDKPKA